MNGKAGVKAGNGTTLKKFWEYVPSITERLVKPGNSGRKPKYRASKA